MRIFPVLLGDSQLGRASRTAFRDARGYGTMSKCQTRRALWELALWGAFGGVAVEAVEILGAVKRVGRLPWKVPGEVTLGALMFTVALRLGIGAGLAAALGQAGQISGGIGAVAAGVGAPLILEQMGKQLTRNDVDTEHARDSVAPRPTGTSAPGIAPTPPLAPASYDHTDCQGGVSRPGAKSTSLPADEEALRNLIRDLDGKDFEEILDALNDVPDELRSKYFNRMDELDGLRATPETEDYDETVDEFGTAPATFSALLQFGREVGYGMARSTPAFGGSADLRSNKRHRRAS